MLGTPSSHFPQQLEALLPCFVEHESPDYWLLDHGDRSMKKVWRKRIGCLENSECHSESVSAHDLWDSLRGMLMLILLSLPLQ